MWKEKAKERREENKNLKKRVQESRQSRDCWKRKHREELSKRLELESKLKKTLGYSR